MNGIRNERMVGVEENVMYSITAISGLTARC